MSRPTTPTPTAGPSHLGRPESPLTPLDITRQQEEEEEVREIRAPGVEEEDEDDEDESSMDDERPEPKTIPQVLNKMDRMDAKLRQDL